jgi:hypothetical protein
MNKEYKLKIAYSIYINKTFFDDYKYQTLVILVGWNNHTHILNTKYMITLYYKNL